MIYDHIINAIKLKKNLNSDQQLATYLQGLKMPLKLLRKAYKSYPVEVDYSIPENQIAYLIGYFPHYSFLLFHILKSHSQHFSRYKHTGHQLNLFGGGPCPEILSYCKFAQLINFSPLAKIDVVNIDIAANTWAYSRDMNIQHIVPYYDANKLIDNPLIYQHDIANSPSQFISLDLPNIVVFQNCLNEPDIQKHNSIVAQFKDIFQILPSNSTITIVDFAYYPKVLDLIEKIETSLQTCQDCQIIKGVRKLNQSLISPLKLLPIITDNLLTGKEDGLIPRKYINYTSSIIYKT